jgi:hypothetical protein
MATYNGWNNRDTWLTGLWLNNEEKNYRKVLQHKDFLSTASDEYLRTALSAYYYGDKINFSKVKWSEIRDMIKEM